MFQKITSYCLIFAVAGLWLVGCNRTLLRQAYEMGWFPDDYRYGDLYRMSNLGQFKEKTLPCASKFSSPTTKKNLDLYLIGDSFTEAGRVSQDDFVAQRFSHTHWADSLEIRLDTSKRNVLILETVERHFREHFAAPVRNLRVVSGLPKPYPKQEEGWYKEIEERLTSFLFSRDAFLQFQEWKAALNLRWFGRSTRDVSISPDGQHLLFSWDTDSTRITSSFNPMSDSELDQLIAQVNQTKNYYLKVGFDEVYLALIPNKTSMVAPEMGTYNHAIERAQTHPALKTPFIDSWRVFVPNRLQIYSRSDTHWNCKGQALWLNEVNGILGSR